MTTPGHDEPTLDDVIQPTETSHPDHREHGKSPVHVDDELLEHRTRHEREEVDRDS